MEYPPYSLTPYQSTYPYHPGQPIPAQPIPLNPYDKFCVGSFVYYDKNPNCTGVIKMIRGNMAGLEMVCELVIELFLWYMHIYACTYFCCYYFTSGDLAALAEWWKWQNTHAINGFVAASTRPVS